MAMNFHSNQNTTVMSTVFKLKAAVLLVFAMLVVGVSDAWAQIVISVNGSTTGELCFKGQPISNPTINYQKMSESMLSLLKKKSVFQ